MSTSLFQVDLNGILKVLSDSLYSSYQVFLRELLQNSIDAIHARKAIDSFTPAIAVGYFDEDGVRTLTVEDNGVGLTFEEVDEFLSKIGSSSKKGIDRDSFIGQFGIGLLSCFMVSDEVVVLSKSAKNKESVKWVGNINGSYRKELLQEEIETGTRVFLKIKDSVKLDTELLEELLHRYGDYLEYPITFEATDSAEQSFQKKFPWEKTALDDSVLRLGKEKFQEDFSNFIPLQDWSGKTKGIAYIIPRVTHFGSVNAHCVYVKRMFITDKSAEVLPEWAFFVRAIVNSDNVSPTASREEIYKNTTLDQVREDLGECIKNYLKELSKTSKETLNQILRIHNEALKSLALQEDDFFTFIAGWFVFPTSEGNLNLNEIRKKTKVVLYVPDIDQFRQLLPIARANNQLIVNGGYIYDTQIFRKLAESDKSHSYQPIDTEYFGNILNELSLEEYDQVRDRLAQLQYHIQEFNCELEIKRFFPESMPAIFYMSQDNLLERDITSIQDESDDLWADITDSVFEFSAQFHSKLFLNYDNPLVRKLLHGKDSTVDGLFVEMIYVNSLMLGHYPLKHKELEVMNTNLLKLFEKVI